MRPVLWFLLLFLKINWLRARMLPAADPKYRLFKQIFANSDALIKPREAPINVTVNLFPINLGQINEDGIGSVNFYLEMIWMDGHLKWNPKDFDDINCTFVPISKIWVPNFTFVTNKVESLTEWNPRDMAHLCSNGLVTKTTAARATVTTEFDILYFPYDEQHLQFYVGHDIAGTDQVNPDTTIRSWNDVLAVGYKFYCPPEWQVLSYTCIRRQYSFESTIYSNWAAIHCTLRIQRLAGAYITSVCVPTIYICGLTVVGIHGVSLFGRDQNSKFKVACTSFMTVLILIWSVAENMPRSKGCFTRLHIFFYTEIGVIFFSVLMSLLGPALKNKLLKDLLDIVCLLILPFVIVGALWWFASEAK